MDPLEFTSANLLVKAFAPDDLAALVPSFTRVDLERGKPLVHSGRQVTHVYFPEGSIASVIGGEPNAPTEIGLVGRDGMTGVSVLLGGGSASLTTFIQVNGSAALCLEADVLRGQFAKSAALRALMLRYVHTFMMQIASCVVSNAHQRIEARLARFLLMCHDRVDGDEIALTHEFMSLMVSSQRPGVTLTLTLHELEGAGMIRSTRGKVTVLDRAKLAALAGITYGQPEAEYRRLIGDFGKLRLAGPDRAPGPGHEHAHSLPVTGILGQGPLDEPFLDPRLEREAKDEQARAGHRQRRRPDDGHRHDCSEQSGVDRMPHQRVGPAVDHAVVFAQHHAARPQPAEVDPRPPGERETSDSQRDHRPAESVADRPECRLVGRNGPEHQQEPGRGDREVIRKARGDSVLSGFPRHSAATCQLTIHANHSEAISGMKCPVTGP